MKNSYKFLCIIAIITIVGASCSEDFLEKYPLDTVSSESFWKSEKDFEIYVNQFYNMFDKRTGVPKYEWENGSDNVVGFQDIAFPSGKIYNISSDAPSTNNSWNNTYTWLRKINYFLEQKEKTPDVSEIGRQYIGEALFFRAYANFQLLENFGGAPYIDKTLNLSDSEQLYSQRMERSAFAQKIMDDLDNAIENLQWAGEGACVPGRISKDAALGFKSRWALFEGSWEYYHKGTVFGVTGKDGENFLNQAMSASQQLMDRLGTSIYIGSEQGKEYWELHQLINLTNIPGVLFYRSYNQELGVTSKWYDYAEAGGAIGFTKSLVDDYLMESGMPKELSSDYMGDDVFANLMANRDPRLPQSVYFYEKWGIFNEAIGSERYAFLFTGTNQTQMYRFAPTGFFIMKGVTPDISHLTRNGGGYAGLIYLRYAEVLLNYAEAKAILGSLIQTDIDKTINVVRDRIGMGHMDLAAVNSWESNSSYIKRYPNESALINEIRRERRVEFAGEGLRYNDLRRWREFGTLIQGWIPRGAKAQQFIDYFNSIGVNSQAWVDSEGYLLAGGFRSDFSDGGTGFLINESRDYLNAIPRSEIDLYKEKADITLEQNPGWE